MQDIVQLLAAVGIDRHLSEIPRPGAFEEGLVAIVTDSGGVTAMKVQGPGDFEFLAKPTAAHSVRWFIPYTGESVQEPVGQVLEELASVPETADDRFLAGLDLSAEPVPPAEDAPESDDPTEPVSEEG